MANKAIAFALEVCESTMKVHIRNIMNKLNATSRTHVVYSTRNLFASDQGFQGIWRPEEYAHAGGSGMVTGPMVPGTIDQSVGRFIRSRLWCGNRSSADTTEASDTMLQARLPARPGLPQ